MDHTDATTITADDTTIPITVTLVGAEGESLYHDRGIRPQTTARDVVADLKLRGYFLRNPESKAPFAPNDDIYAVMYRLQEQGSWPKIEAVPDMQVAVTSTVVAPAGATHSHSSAPVVQQRAAPLVTARPAAPPPVIDRMRFSSVPRPMPAYWEEAGWTQRADGSWFGQYRLPQGTWEGEIVRIAPSVFQSSIIDPPEVVTHHPHAACLGRSGADGRRRLHFSVVPTSISAAIIAVEIFLAESFVAARRGD